MCIIFEFFGLSGRLQSSPLHSAYPLSHASDPVFPFRALSDAANTFFSVVLFPDAALRASPLTTANVWVCLGLWVNLFLTVNTIFNNNDQYNEEKQEKSPLKNEFCLRGEGWAQSWGVARTEAFEHCFVHHFLDSDHNNNNDNNTTVCSLRISTAVPEYICYGVPVIPIFAVKIRYKSEENTFHLKAFFSLISGRCQKEPYLLWGASQRRSLLPNLC